MQVQERIQDAAERAPTIEDAARYFATREVSGLDQGPLDGWFFAPYPELMFLDVMAFNSDQMMLKPEPAHVCAVGRCLLLPRRQEGNCKRPS